MDKYPEIPNKSSEDLFLIVLDGMIESTQEFIGDDEVTKDNDPEGRLEDLKALEHVHALYVDAFATYDWEAE